jgi:hypothetical protein
VIHGHVSTEILQKLLLLHWTKTEFHTVHDRHQLISGHLVDTGSRGIHNDRAAPVVCCFQRIWRPLNVLAIDQRTVSTDAS